MSGSFSGDRAASGESPAVGEVALGLGLMIVRSIAGGVEVLAPAKLNLFLEVLGRRPDGYHEIESVMVAVSLYDTLTFTDDPSGEISLRCNDPALPVGSDNLVVMAAERSRRRRAAFEGRGSCWTRRSRPRRGWLAARATRRRRSWRSTGSGISGRRRATARCPGGGDRQRRGLLHACSGRGLPRAGRAGGAGSA